METKTKPKVDKINQNKVVLGLSGGIDSMVTATLLKIQKYEVFAVTVVNEWEELSNDSQKTFSCGMSQEKIKAIKSFCDKQHIPLHILKATEEFKEKVIDPWISDKITGQRARACWDCHDLRMKLLHKKMEDLGAGHIATGHYAKVFRNAANGTAFIHSSNDELHDQSSALSRCSNKILSNLLLPLSDLTKKEVLKLAENFGLVSSDKKLSFNECFKPTPELIQILDKKIPSKLKKPGEIVKVDGTSAGNHDGIYRHSFGEPIEFKDYKIDGVFGQTLFFERRIKLVPESNFETKRFLLVRCIYSEEVSLLEPLKGYILYHNDKYAECHIYPKSLGSVYVELSENIKIYPKDIVTLLKKRGKNAKIIGTGEVQFFQKKNLVQEGAESVPKVDFSRDF